MSVTRYERVDFAESELARPEKTTDGYWKLEGKIARSGIQEYRRADGSTVRELRLPADVEASANGFALLPLTNGHPPGMVTPENAKQYAIGAVGHADYAGGWIKAPVTVWSKDGIGAIKAGRAQLSVGYQCTLVEEAGEYEGQRYDCRQIDIVPNHLAIVDVARAGPAARLRLDSNSAIALDSYSVMSDQTEPKSMHKFLMDGLTIEVADANAQAIIERAVASEKERADAAEKREGEKDKRITELTAKVDVQDAQIKELKDAADKASSAKSDEFKALLTLGAEVTKLGVDVSKLDHSELAYKAAAVKKLRPSLSLDGKGAEYIAAVYDIAKSEQPSAVSSARAGHGDNVTHRDDSVDSGPEAARQRMLKRNAEMFVK